MLDGIYYLFFNLVPNNFLLVSYGLYDDTALFTLIKEGSVAAFDELYERYWLKMLVRANVLLHSQEDAEEVVNDVFITFWKKRETIEIKISVKAYLSAMLQYACFTILANGKRKRKTISNTEITDIADDGTEQWLSFEQLRNELEKAVCQLPEKCRLIFRLSREEGMTDKEIAKTLDISVNTVRTQMNRALTKLKTTLHSFFIF